MSGGKRIDDHSFWAGKGDKSSVFPEGVHTKQDSSAMGSGGMNEYEDTTEKIKSQQDMGVNKVKANKQKHLYRN